MYDHIILSTTKHVQYYLPKANTNRVFPLRNKLLNVREASHKQIMDNKEIANLKQMLGISE